MRLLLVVLIGLLSPLSGIAQDESARVKAALVYNLMRFVSFPPDSSNHSASVNLCLLNKHRNVDTPFSDMQGRKAGGRTIDIIWLTPDTEPNNCHFVYLAPADESYFRAYRERYAGKPVVTIGEWEKHARSGGMVGLIIRDNRWHFEINIDTARQVGVTFNAQLLSLSTVIKGH